MKGQRIEEGHEDYARMVAWWTGEKKPGYLSGEGGETWRVYEDNGKVFFVSMGGLAENYGGNSAKGLTHGK